MSPEARLTRDARWKRPALLLALSVAACAKPPGDTGEPPSRTSNLPQAGRPTLPPELTPKPGASAIASAVVSGSPAASVTPGDGGAEPTGPQLAVTAIAAAVFSEPRFDNRKKIGYVRNGGRVGILGEPVGHEACSKGWYALVGGGYLCANQATTELTHPEVQFAIRAPALDDILPYPYARNAKNGTPLYKSVPSHEQMLTYEPYLDTAKKKKSHDGGEEDDEDDAPAASGKTKPAASPAASLDRPKPAAPEGDDTTSGAIPGAAAASEPPPGGLAPEEAPSADAGAPQKPWWQSEDKTELSKVTLEQLTAESDDVLAKRMVAGFYVAVDKTFAWNGRTWYKTTKGLVTPADRFWLTTGMKFSGVDVDGQKYKLPLAWTYGGRKTSPTYTLDEAGKAKPARSVDTFSVLQLTGNTREAGGTSYLEIDGGTWVKAAHVRVTAPGPAPTDLAADERWVDVNLTTQTLVVFEGEKPVYATLVSSGKQSTIKDKDHRTPTGSWRIREKHITTTMDGNGGAAGDLPYSIEDVPYVMYFHNSYALHAAFWHRNFGIQMSHGCVNLAPLDAKRVFFLTDPPLPRGWHGAWATPEHPGSRVVVHE